MSVQRRRGRTAKVFSLVETVDNRGNKTVEVDRTSYVEVRAAFIPQRSANAEVPGHQMINVVRMLCDPDIGGVEMWSMVEFDGALWDVITPPAVHWGTRGVRHVSVDLRRRGVA